MMMMMMKNNCIYKRLCEIRAQNINEIIIAELNINSIRNKFEQLAEYINKNIDILLIVGYQHFRADRSSRGGGLLFYISNNIPAKQIKLYAIQHDIKH